MSAELDITIVGNDTPPSESPPSILDDLESAWNIIANVDWEKQTNDWRKAASALRDRYLNHIRDYSKANANPPSCGRSGILYYPEGGFTADMTDKGLPREEIPNHIYAAKVLAKIATGEAVALPSQTNEHGKRTWEFIPLS